MRIHEIVLDIIGVYFVSIGLATQTKGWPPALMYKIIPYFCGMYCIFYGIFMSGFVKIGG